MFKNYQNIDPSYIPDNSTCMTAEVKSYTKIAPNPQEPSYVERNIRGEVIGYSWNYGQTLDLQFHVDGEITVEQDAIILTQSGETPELYKGTVGQRAYNVVDLRSWTCVAVMEDTCYWAEDDEFTYNEEAEKKVIIPSSRYLMGKKIVVKLYNFRFEEIEEQIFTGKSVIVYPITKERSEKMKRGVYYCAADVVSFNEVLPIFTTSDCILVVR